MTELHSARRQQVLAYSLPVSMNRNLTIVLFISPLLPSLLLSFSPSHYLLPFLPIPKNGSPVSKRQAPSLLRQYIVFSSSGFLLLVSTAALATGMVTTVCYMSHQQLASYVTSCIMHYICTWCVCVHLLLSRDRILSHMLSPHLGGLPM